LIDVLLLLLAKWIKQPGANNCRSSLGIAYI
jgi:hypothetical protein